MNNKWKIILKIITLLKPKNYSILASVARRLVQLGVRLPNPHPPTLRTATVTNIANISQHKNQNIIHFTTKYGMYLFLHTTPHHLRDS